MKRTLVLVVVMLSFVLAGCGDDRYAMEKRFWQAQKQMEKIFRNPDASPPRELARVVAVQEAFSKRYPKTALAVSAQFNIARLYLVKKDYRKARLQLQRIVREYTKFPAVCAEAVFLTGNSYEIDDKWGLALEQYKKIMQVYPTTRRGMDVPVYIAQHYKIKYQPDKMLGAFQEASLHYKNLAQKYPLTPFGYTNYMLAVNCYIAVNDWQSALSTLDSMAQVYRDKLPLDGIYMNMAGIYFRGFKDKIKTKEMLEKILKEYPKGRFAKMATLLIKELDKK
ncbi:MAG TPA: tetratricopeptide repeat protein [Candidatus Omnitrophota bacterium]|nr:tetratricopeptide repeat protein [Candidatus Omnitrophota bacterium]